VSDDRTALFVRLPAPLLGRLEARIRAEGRTKQSVVEQLLASQLNVAVDVEATDEIHDDEILDLAGTAALLRVDEGDVLARIAEGDFPARRFGEAWRCSRTAVLAWLAGTDPVGRRATGFSAR
jgi:hypothetical protein